MSRFDNWDICMCYHIQCACFSVTDVSFPGIPAWISVSDILYSVDHCSSEKLLSWCRVNVSEMGQHSYDYCMTYSTVIHLLCRNICQNYPCVGPPRYTVVAEDLPVLFLSKLYQPGLVTISFNQDCVTMAMLGQLALIVVRVSSDVLDGLCVYCECPGFNLRFLCTRSSIMFGMY